MAVSVYASAPCFVCVCRTCQALPVCQESWKRREEKNEKELYPSICCDIRLCHVTAWRSSEAGTIQQRSEKQRGRSWLSRVIFRLPTAPGISRILRGAIRIVREAI